MKKSITGVVVLLAGAFVAHSQGTVSFGNYAQLSSYIYVSFNGTKLGGSAAHTGTTADTADGNDWTVALYGNAGTTTPLVQLLDANNVPVTASMETANPLVDGVAGTWYSTQVGDVPGTTGAGASATVQVFAWYNDNGTITSYSAAKAAGVPSGFSATGTTTTGGPNVTGPPSTAGALPNLGTIALSGTIGTTIPEPSTIALGVMGASAFLLRLRKK